MKMLLAVLAGLMTLLAPLPAHAVDWTQTVNRAPGGAFVIGNPKAKVKLVEYLSMTCSHCAHFSAEAWGPLKARYIGKGLLSLEVRHAIRDGYDLTASLLARCGGPQAYLGATEAVLGSQTEWLGRAADIPEEGLEGKPIGERMIAMAHGVGLDAMFEKRGLPRERIAACLSSPAEQKLLAGMAEEAWKKREIGGTPAFLINGTLMPGTVTWETLEPKLQAALK